MSVEDHRLSKHLYERHPYSPCFSMNGICRVLSRQPSHFRLARVAKTTLAVAWLFGFPAQFAKPGGAQTRCAQTMPADLFVGPPRESNGVRRQLGKRREHAVWGCLAKSDVGSNAKKCNQICNSVIWNLRFRKGRLFMPIGITFFRRSPSGQKRTSEMTKGSESILPPLEHSEGGGVYAFMASTSNNTEQ